MSVEDARFSKLIDGLLSLWKEIILENSSTTLGL